MRQGGTEHKTREDLEPDSGKPNRLGVMLVIYLLGLLVGGLYVGMVSPVRTVVQSFFGIDGATGIWMINIYTLFYAALIPVIGKIADREGRKRVFVICVGIFCVGATICGLSHNIGGFGLLLVGRVIQAVGAGGMIPVANAAIGTSFPAEKRGMALGLAGVVMGISNVFGAAAGSAVVGLFGVQNWNAMFYLCIPLCIVLMLAAGYFLPTEDRAPGKHPMDVLGATVFALFVLFLLLAIRTLYFTNLGSCLVNPLLWTYVICAILCAFAFRAVEKRAPDPVFHLEYFQSKPIVVTMVVSFFIGCFIMSMVLVPELAEYAMGDPLGSGGYYVIAIGITSFITTPISGKLIDKIGPKPVLMTGLAISIVGLLFLALVAVVAPSMPTLIAGLAVVGAGMGMAMGAPTNYMILENTDKKDATSAIATITLIRQIGTSLSPAIFVGLIASAPGLAGYQNMLFSVVVFNALAFLTMAFYRPQRN